MVCILLWIMSRYNQKETEPTVHSVVLCLQCLLDVKQSGPEILSLSLSVKMRALWQNCADWEQVWPPLNSLRELVCMHQWLTGSWAPDNHPLLQALLLHCWQWLGCRDSQLLTYCTLEWELLLITGWYRSSHNKVMSWRWAILVHLNSGKVVND